MTGAKVVTLIMPPQFETLQAENKMQTERYRYYSSMPYGMGIMASTMRRSGFDVVLIDCLSLLGDSDQENPVFLYDYWDDVDNILSGRDLPETLKDTINILIDKMSFDTTDIVGFSIPTLGHFLFAVMLAREIKERYFVKIVFGGAFTILYGSLYDDLLKFIDFYIVGDAVNVFPALVQCLRNQNEEKNIELPNLIYRKGKNIYRTTAEHLPLGELLIPDFDGLDLKIYKDNASELILPYGLSRGCKYNCAFCVRNPVEKAFETKAYAQILQDLNFLINKYKSHTFQFCDSNLGCNREFLKKILKGFISDGLEISWRVYIGICEVDAELLSLMKKAGCVALSFGVESGSDRILQSINKPQTSKQTKEIVKITKDNGIETSVSFMAGYPHETDKDVKATLAFIQKIKKYIDFSVVRKFTITYGSRIHTDPKKYGITNLKAMSSRMMFSFDEVSGLAWPQFTKRQEKIKKSMMKLLY